VNEKKEKGQKRRGAGARHLHKQRIKPSQEEERELQK